MVSAYGAKWLNLRVSKPGTRWRYSHNEHNSGCNIAGFDGAGCSDDRRPWCFLLGLLISTVLELSSMLMLVFRALDYSTP